MFFRMVRSDYTESPIRVIDFILWRDKWVGSEKADFTVYVYSNLLLPIST